MCGRKKIKRAVTDSGRDIIYDEERPGIANLMSIYSSLTGEPFDAIEKAFEGKGYGEFKNDVAEVVVDFLRPLREKYAEISSDREGLKKMLARNAGRALTRAQATLDAVHEVLGFIPRE